MPYIPQEQREDPADLAEPSGGLNYQITVLVDQFLACSGLSYKSINTAIGALECAKLELYRRVAAPYEDVKLAENGDVYTQN